MKLFFYSCERGAKPSVGTFVGNNFLIDEMGPVPNTITPEPMRNLDGGAWSVSKFAIKAVEEGDAASYEMVRYAANMARAIAFAGRLEPMARLFRACAGQRPGCSFGRVLAAVTHTAGFNAAWTLQEAGSFEALEEAYEAEVHKGSPARPVLVALGLDYSETEAAALIGLTSDVVHKERIEAEHLLPGSWLVASPPPPAA